MRHEDCDQFSQVNGKPPFAQEFIMQLTHRMNHPAGTKRAAVHKKHPVTLLGVEIDNLTMDQAVDAVIEAAKEPSPTSLAFVNADCLNIAHVNSAYARVLSRQHNVFADGVGVKLAAKMNNVDIRANVNGTDMFPLLCKAAAEHGLRIYLLGGMPGVAAQAAENMSRDIPGLRIVGTHHGYFSADEEAHIVDEINASGATILLVGLGAPRQEMWIHRNLCRLAPAVSIGVGGLFDYYSGRLQRAPVLMRKCSLEWLWRLILEPRRLARRYLIGNLLFVMRCLNDRLHSIDQTGLPQTGHASVAYSCKTRTSWHRRFQWFALGKRTLDVMVGGAALTVLSPLLLLTAVAIKLESPGPVFFKQTRVGLHGERFDIWKFRSMYIDAEERRARLLKESDRSGSHFKMRSDPRITRVGRLIRRLSVDELPQLWNVLNGSMSLVGPRPNLETEVAAYRLEELSRLNVKPGITCTWQVSGRAELPWEKQVQLDLDYVYEPSLKSDFSLLMRTIPAVLTGRGAY
jgi:exopolysaccharide biosynthesis WecB/TagA/CpsF family protein